MKHRPENDRPRSGDHYTVSIFRNGTSRAVRLPKAFDPEGVDQMEVTREGDRIILRPVRPSWDSFWDRPAPDGIDDFLRERADVVEPGRFELADEELAGSDLVGGDLVGGDPVGGDPVGGERERGA